ncbi:MAG: nucleotide sugar dehydrogenase [Magnetococcales bacterium]|nr:nucleotide sugar dehydrogenase [Magnetococcales bacterium]
MKIVICGMGYVGITVSACLLKQGHHVVGVDIDPAKVDLLARGVSPINEPEIDGLLQSGLQAGLLTSDTNLKPHLVDASMVFVCVGTPTAEDGSLDNRYLRQAAADIGQGVTQRPADAESLICVIRSTAPPTTIRSLIVPTMEAASGESPGSGRYDVVFNPEFLRESTAVYDYFNPPKIVIGEREQGVSDRMRGIYDGIDAPLFEVSWEVAEMVKFTDNAFHALKVSFSNEIGRLAQTLGVDPAQTMDIFVSDTKLNISPYYMKPGGAFGGSCLPKDVRAINALGHGASVDMPIMANIMNSNQSHKDYLAQRVMTRTPKGGRILQLGLSFKTNTDDLRESPLLDLANTLIGEGYVVDIYDPDLSSADGQQPTLQHMALQENNPQVSQAMIDKLPDMAPYDVVVFGKAIIDMRELKPLGDKVINIHRLEG